MQHPKRLDNTPETSVGQYTVGMDRTYGDITEQPRLRRAPKVEQSDHHQPNQQVQTGLQNALKQFKSYLHAIKGMLKTS
jgi:hypothetical protein